VGFLLFGESSRNRPISAGCAPEWNWSSAAPGLSYRIEYVPITRMFEVAAAIASTGLTPEYDKFD
jgi:hypothetical protein